MDDLAPAAWMIRGTFAALLGLAASAFYAAGMPRRDVDIHVAHKHTALQITRGKGHDDIDTRYLVETDKGTFSAEKNILPGLSATYAFLQDGKSFHCSSAGHRSGFWPSYPNLSHCRPR